MDFSDSGDGAVLLRGDYDNRDVASGFYSLSTIVSCRCEGGREYTQGGSYMVVYEVNNK